MPTAETVAGVVRLPRRAAELVWTAVDAEGAGSARQVSQLVGYLNSGRHWARTSDL